MSESALSRADRRIAISLFVLAFVTYAWFFGGGGWNQNAQFDLTRALVERQTLHVEGYRVNTGDVSWTQHPDGWRVYINKPPGVSFLAAVPYAPAYFIERSLHSPIDSWRLMTINGYLTTAFTCGLTGALIPVVLYLYGRRRGVSAVTSTAVALAIAFGTIVFPYSTMLFAHVPAALFLLLAFVWLDERPLLAGVAAGIAGVCFYICIPAAAVLFVGLLVSGGSKRALRFAAGGVPFGILIGLYHYVCFGSPFRTSVEASTNFTQKGLLFGVFHAPSLDALWGLTFSEYRGLFFVSPVLLLALIGAFRTRRRDSLMIFAIAAIFLVSIASFNGWEGGAAFGPRYLLPVIPLLGIPILFVRGRALAAIGVVLGVVSFGMQWIATTVHPMPDGRFQRPLRTYLIPSLLEGHSSLNTQSMDELIPNKLYAPGSHQSQWASFNAGELFTGPDDPASAYPIVLWVLLGSAVVTRWARGHDPSP